MLRKFLRIVLKHNIYEVNLGIFALFRRSSSIDAAPTGLKGLGQTRFYTDTVATRLKRVLEVPAENPVRLGNRNYQTWNEESGSVGKPKLPDLERRIRFGWETETTRPGTKNPVRLGNRTYQTWNEYPVRLGNRNYQTWNEESGSVGKPKLPDLERVSGSVGNAGRMNQRYEGFRVAFPGVSTPQNRTCRPAD